MVVNIRYGNHSSDWESISSLRLVGAVTTGTDAGFCCFVVPQIFHLPKPNGTSVASLYKDNVRKIVD